MVPERCLYVTIAAAAVFEIDYEWTGNVILEFKLHVYQEQ